MRCKGHRFNPWVRKIPWRRKRQPTPVFLPGKSQGQRSLVGYGPWGCKESDMTEPTRRLPCKCQESGCLCFCGHGRDMAKNQAFNAPRQRLIGQLCCWPFQNLGLVNWSFSNWASVFLLHILFASGHPA